jgi:hypothetical protein
MTEIIKPKFSRKRLHQLRMLKSKPSLSNHPEFQHLTTEHTPDVVKPTLLVALVGLIFLVFRRH